MRNSDQSNSSNRRGGSPRKNSNRNSNSRPKSNNNQQPRSQNAKSARNKQATELWLSPSSQTLTSHIGIVSRSKDGNTNGGPKKKDNRNGQAAGNGTGSRNRSKHSGDKQRHNKHSNPRGRNQNTTNQNGDRNGSHSAPRKDSAPRNASSGDREKLVANIEPFELFCAYHLGITQDNQFKPANINEVARRFRSDPATIRQALKEYDMDSQSLLDRDFDMALSQLDIQVCPEGVDRGEIAKTIYAEFLDAPRVERDWKKILDEDRKENQKIFKS